MKDVAVKVFVKVPLRSICESVYQGKKEEEIFAVKQTEKFMLRGRLRLRIFVVLVSTMITYSCELRKAKR